MICKTFVIHSMKMAHFLQQMSLKALLAFILSQATLKKKTKKPTYSLQINYDHMHRIYMT